MGGKKSERGLREAQIPPAMHAICERSDLAYVETPSTFWDWRSMAECEAKCDYLDRPDGAS